MWSIGPTQTGIAGNWPKTTKVPTELQVKSLVPSHTPGFLRPWPSYSDWTLLFVLLWYYLKYYTIFLVEIARLFYDSHNLDKNLSAHEFFGYLGVSLFHPEHKAACRFPFHPPI
ncbi:hypothetical protein [Merdimmobilis hominis]|uniref:hypothetical protein n=1 Tax=Merdimmobilis hominis TaxID=2897707 RepID=UPI00128F96D7|nr:hypothetical protein [Merdimmobilis hominis]